jgi:hypothetical protein
MMTGVEEMTRRRDAWRERAESAVAELKAERLARERAEEALATERARCARLTGQVTAARAEATAHLAWVRRLQKDLEHWKLNSKTLAQMYIRQGRIVAWLGPISACPTRHGEPRRCLRDCTDGCGFSADQCFGHEHCDMCGAVRCHGFWWRRRW